MERVVIIEYILILCISLLLAIGGVFFELWTKHTNRRRKKMDVLIARLFSEKIENIKEFFPKKYQKLELIVPALEQIEKKVASPYWGFFKENMLHKLIRKEVLHFVLSRSWRRTTIGLRAIELAPLPEYQPYVLPLLQDNTDIVRYRAIKAAIALNSYQATKHLIQVMSSLPLMLQFPYRDALSDAPLSVHQYILKIYRSSNDPSLLVHCLKILSTKTGLLSSDEIQGAIESDNTDLSWWGLFSLSNNQYDCAKDLLEQYITSEHWKKQAVSAYSIGILGIKELAPHLMPLLESEHYWVRYIAAAALRFLKEDGLAILEEVKNSEKSVAKNIAQYMLDLHSSEFRKGIRGFFPLNLDSAILNEPKSHNV